MTAWQQLDTVFSKIWRVCGHQIAPVMASGVTTGVCDEIWDSVLNHESNEAANQIEASIKSNQSP